MYRIREINARDTPNHLQFDAEGCAVADRSVCIAPNYISSGGCKLEYIPSGKLVITISENTPFVCGFCGKSYDNSQDYAACVSKCASMAERKAEEEKKKKLEAEKENRIHEIRAAEKHVKALYDAWHRDYGWRWEDPFTEVLRVISRS